MNMGVSSGEMEAVKSVCMRQKTSQTLWQTFVTFLVLTASSDGFCQLTNATNKINQLSVWLAGLAATVFTIALLYVGYKCIFAGAAFRDMWSILLGGFLVGGAAGLASFATA